MSIDNILWSTRGFEWGFKLLLKPKIDYYDWHDFYKNVFGKSDDYNYLIKSEISFKNINYKFVAVRFLDPCNRKDSSNRPIFHEIAFFDDDLYNLNYDEIVNKSWNCIEKLYLLYYSLKSEDVPSINSGIICNENLEYKSSISNNLLFLFAIIVYLLGFGTSYFINYSNYCDSKSIKLLSQLNKSNIIKDYDDIFKFQENEKIKYINILKKIKETYPNESISKIGVYLVYSAINSNYSSNSN